MATRPETARKILIHWMDGVFGFLAVFFLAMVIVAVADGKISILHGVVVGICLMGVCGLFLLIMRAAFDDKPRPTWLLVLSGGCAVVATLLVPPGSPEGSWDMAAGLWLAGLAMHVRLRVIIPWMLGVLVACTLYITSVTSMPWQLQLLTQAVNCVLTVISMMLWLWLWRTIREAHQGKEAKARLAVSEERLRFARDLHDLLGHSLSVISLKSELAAKLSDKDIPRAAAEIAQVRALTAEARLEVDAAVQGYRSLDLDAELTGVRAALEAAGARCTIEADAGDLSPAARALLAWVVREGATNILRHSTATRCVITLHRGVLEMRNDGVHGWNDGTGSGLRGLSERLATVGGSLEAAPTGDGEFVVRAVVPA